jgi:hypothetical protein
VNDAPLEVVLVIYSYTRGGGVAGLAGRQLRESARAEERLMELGLIDRGGLRPLPKVAMSTPFSSSKTYSSHSFSLPQLLHAAKMKLQDTVLGGRYVRHYICGPSR